MSKSCYIVGRDYSVFTVMESLGYQPLTSMQNADVVVLTGGADISPSVYNHPRHSSVHASPSRDAVEIAAVKQAEALGKPIIGICRGGQLLHALVGGKLWQHVNNHFGSHETTDLRTGEKYIVTSIHHQMMIPREYTNTCEVLAVTHGWASSRIYWNDDLKSWVDDEGGYDVEALVYHDRKWLCFQGHPEYDEFLPNQNRTVKLFASYLPLIGV